MTEAYLTTDIIVIIVLVVVIVIIGVAAFFIHFYWTKIGVADIWNTTKWSSMRSSFYRTIRRFSQGSTTKFADDQELPNEPVYLDGIDDGQYQKKRSNPMITSYVTYPNYTPQNPVSIVSYNHSSQNNYATRTNQPIGNAGVHGNNYTYYNNNNNNQYNNLASMIQKQRF